jgi:diguanylate cyclase (GGDEF)-like protein
MSTDQSRKKLTIVQKLIAGYAAMAILSMVAIVYSIIGISAATTAARNIVKHDLVVINTAIKLRESLLSMQGYSGKYIILKSPEFKELYKNREKEFLASIGELAKIHDKQEIDDLAKAFDIYRYSVAGLFQNRKTSISTLNQDAEKVFYNIDNIYSSRQSKLQAKLLEVELQERATVRLALLLSFSGLLIGISVAAFITFSIYRAIWKLKKATQIVAEGNFDHVPDIQPGDEIGDLASDFTKMARRLKELEQISLDASPLTRLPGNIAIERALSRRLAENTPFAVCYADLDNLKAYNDRYGYIKASEVIRLTGEVIHETVLEIAGNNPFIGHVGGDDFVMIVDEQEAAAVCESTIERFEQMIRDHYSAEDLENGAFEGFDRYGVLRNFPIMTISIAVVICRQGLYDSAVDIARTAAEIKDYVKGMSGSNYFINRRKSSR